MTLDRSIGPRCNIGPAEVARRRRSAIAFTVLAALVAAALVALDVAPAGRLAMFPFATGAAINWLQVVHRFCVAFGPSGSRISGRSEARHELIRRSERRTAGASPSWFSRAH